MYLYVWYLYILDGVVLWQAMAYRGLSRHVDLEALPEPGARFSLQELIGEGTYGEVYSARETATGESTVS